MSFGAADLSRRGTVDAETEAEHQKEMDKLLRANDRLETHLEGVDTELERARYKVSRVPARI